MIEQSVPYSEMSCLFQQDKDLEILPEPFRLQQNVTFYVMYSEYVKYIKSFEDLRKLKLSYDASYLRALAVSGSQKLYNCFLADMAFAICKEVSFSEECDLPASVILPAAYGVELQTVSSFASLYSNRITCEAELFSNVNKSGFVLSGKYTDRNLLLLKTAVLLYHMSKVYKGNTEINLIYKECNHENYCV